MRRTAAEIADLENVDEIQYMDIRVLVRKDYPILTNKFVGC